MDVPSVPDIVVVPHRPGELLYIRADDRRSRDDLDELIDDLLPDVDDRPGWFDAALLATGIGLLGWAFLADAPTFVTVIGVFALTLGCVLPLRSVWRGAGRRGRERRRQGLLTKGVPIAASSDVTARLLKAYDDLVVYRRPLGPVSCDPAIGAAHSAVLESATLLKGREPVSSQERDYVEKRAVAVEDLAAALKALSQPETGLRPEADEVDTVALVEARGELEQITRFNSVGRLEELTEEARIQHRETD